MGETCVLRDGEDMFHAHKYDVDAQRTCNLLLLPSLGKMFSTIDFYVTVKTVNIHLSLILLKRP
jgi:hypothetical protein